MNMKKEQNIKFQVKKRMIIINNTNKIIIKK